MTNDPLFHPLIGDWFEERFGRPTEPQRLGWPHIAAGRHTLIAAPTGSGKTLAAFLVCLDGLLRQWLDGGLEQSVQAIYVSPLKALSNDIQRNLQEPLAEIRQRAEAAGHRGWPLRVALRTGDTPARERQAMLRQPPHLLVTTPESLYLLLTSDKSRQILGSVRTVIVDEIHALARDKRGSHLALSLERLEALCSRPPVRVGLSATQRPIEDMAHFLVGAGHSTEDGRPGCAVIDTGHVRQLDLAVEVPPSQLSAVCSNEQWGEIHQRLTELISSHRSTLIFVNTRRLAERVCHNLTELLGEDAVASHHGSLARPLRLSAEQRLKTGQLKAIVATASLEMGIDIGFIDLVCQIGSPRSIATFLQRVGRSGHSLSATPKGRLFPLTRDELLESLALIRAVREGTLDCIEMPEAPLDILAQQIVAEVACGPWDEQALYGLCRRAWPFRDLAVEQYEAVLGMLSEGISPGSRRGSYLHRDRIGRRLRARRGARLAALTSGGAIPEAADYRVVTEEEGTLVGTVDEDFAIESLAGDVFLLGNTSWQVRYVRAGEVRVRDAQGAPPTIPFWFGEAPGRTVELSGELSRLRQEIAQRAEADAERAPAWLQDHCGAPAWAATQAVQYVQAQQAAMGRIPTQQEIVFERFFDESGGMQLVIHAPLGTRINRAWGLALRKRFCRSFDFELQAAADDNGVLLSLSPQHSFPIENLFRMLGPHNGQALLEQAVLAVPMFQVRWRWNVTRALAVLRHQGGRKVPPYLQRFRSDDLLAAAFPETVGCLENHHGDVPIPDHPLVRQTMHDCLHEAMDLNRWLALLGDVQQGRVRLVACDSREPSPFSHGLLNANPYAFLDGAPLEERRTRAVATRRSPLPDDVRDLARLDPAAIAQVRQQAWPLVRDADELHDALMSLGVLLEQEGSEWTAWFDELAGQGRATTVRRPGQPAWWVAAERWPIVETVFEDAAADPPVALPAELQYTGSRSDGRVELVRGRIAHSGPLTTAELARLLGLQTDPVHAALEALEGEGTVLRGQFTSASAEEAVGTMDGPAGAAGGPGEPDKVADKEPDKGPDKGAVQWCERRLLARIHRLTLDGLRRRIQPVSRTDYLRFLVRHHHLTPETRLEGPLGVREVVQQLQGCELPAGAWEQQVLAARVAEYEPQWLDHLFLSGEVMWGRLRPPRRDEGQGVSMAALTRTVPISLLLREDLPWLLPVERPAVDGFARANAQQVLAALTDRGALFLQELQAVAELLPTHLEEALRELAALGLVTSDAFAAVRALVAARPHAGSRYRRNGRSPARPASAVGRWSRFPGPLAAPARPRALQQWCWQLLRRYGVLFRDLLARETAAPPWHELVPVLRRLELRGEVRGGRFVAGVGGEQYAGEAAVEQLRRVREETDDTSWVVLSAADPLNLLGILTDGPRLPATHKNSFILQAGRCAAVQQAGRIESLQPADTSTQAEMHQALLR